MSIKTKAHVLAEFQNIAHEHYDGNVPESLNKLLARLVNFGLADTEIIQPCAADKGVVYLVGEISEELAMGTGEESGVIDEMLDVHYSLPPEQPITLVISSPGGDVDVGLAIISTINQIRREGRKVNAHVAGWAFSAAFDILQHCDYRTAETTSFLMTHEEQGSVEGSTTKRHNDTQFSKKSERAVFEIIARRTGKPVKFYVDRASKGEWYLSAPEGLAERLLDEIIDIPAFPAPPPEAVAAPKRARRAKTTPPPQAETNATN